MISLNIHAATKIEFETGNVPSGRGWFDVNVTDEIGQESNITIFLDDNLDLLNTLRHFVANLEAEDTERRREAIAS